MAHANSFIMEAVRVTRIILKLWTAVKAVALLTSPFPSKRTLNWNFAFLPKLKDQGTLFDCACLKTSGAGVARLEELGLKTLLHATLLPFR
jgi:hypothetical protein